MDLCEVISINLYDSAYSLIPCTLATLVAASEIDINDVFPIVWSIKNTQLETYTKKNIYPN